MKLTTFSLDSREIFCAVRLLTEAQLLEELSVTRGTLQRWRKQGMPYLALGSRSIRYSLYEILRWFECRNGAHGSMEIEKGDTNVSA